MKTLRHYLSMSLMLCMTSSALLAQDAEDFNSFGAAFDPTEIIKPNELINQLGDADSSHATVMATVEEVCQMKGCWMSVSGPDLNEPIFVKFKDYGFFVPKDISGQEVVMRGVAHRQQTSVEELRHYAKDAGKSQEEIDAITEPKEEITFMASGVLVKKD